MIRPLTILPSLLLVAAALAFVGCDQAAPATAVDPAAAPVAAGPDIVFIEVDSLQTGYTFVAEELARLEENFGKAQANQERRMNALRGEVQKLQNQAQQGLLAPNKIQSEQQRIARKEQEIAQTGQIALASIQEDQLKLQQQFSEQLRGVLEEIQEEEGYDYIVSKGSGSSVLIGKADLDITQEVLLRLNAIARDSI